MRAGGGRRRRRRGRVASSMAGWCTPMRGRSSPSRRTDTRPRGARARRRGAAGAGSGGTRRRAHAGDARRGGAHPRLRLADVLGALLRPVPSGAPALVLYGDVRQRGQGAPASGALAGRDRVSSRYRWVILATGRSAPFSALRMGCPPPPRAAGRPPQPGRPAPAAVTGGGCSPSCHGALTDHRRAPGHGQRTGRLRGPRRRGARDDLRGAARRPVVADVRFGATGAGSRRHGWFCAPPASPSASVDGAAARRRPRVLTLPA